MLKYLVLVGVVIIVTYRIYKHVNNKLDNINDNFSDL